MTRAKNAPRRPVGRPPVPAEQAYSEKIVVALRPAEMEAVRAFVAQHTHLPASTWARQVLLHEVAAAHHARTSDRVAQCTGAPPGPARR
jgi:hypothetical protein